MQQSQMIIAALLLAVAIAFHGGIYSIEMQAGGGAFRINKWTGETRYCARGGCKALSLRESTD
jgi:hypothetical protein